MVNINSKPELKMLYLGIRKHLLENVLSFWYEHSIDKENGGYVTALDRTGKPLREESEKNIWMQARQVWMFSKIYSDIENKEKWLYAARHGYDFLLSSAAYAGNGRWNYLLSQDGMEVIADTVSIFTDAFCLMALCAYAQVTNDFSQKEIIERTFTALVKNLMDEKFKDIFPQKYRDNIVYHGIYMICMNSLSESSKVLGCSRTDPYIRFCLNKIFSIMKLADDNYILECKYSNGAVVDTDAGYVLNSGHSFESLWFVLREAKRLNLEKYCKKAVEIFYALWFRAKDKTYGGVFYMLDVRGCIPNIKDWHIERNLVWNEKVWWTHAEALCALATYMFAVNDQRLLNEFEQLWLYCLEYFWDHEYNGWYSVLHTDGSVRLANKGGLQKAAFHVPRSLYQICLILKEKERTF